MSTTLISQSLASARLGRDLPGAGELAQMCCEVQGQAVAKLSPAERWQWLAEGLMSAHPAHFIRTLRACTALSRLLPEVAALFGVPQLSDASTPVDIGEHQLKVMDEAARVNAPLAVRLAALLHEIGKGDTPPEIWPSHHKHESRGVAKLAVIAERLALPDDVRDLAELVIADADRVHRASELRAGPITLLLTRWQALERPQRFEQLLLVCQCDYAAYDGHSAASYPKAALMRRALAAFRAVDASGLDAEALVEARAQAVAGALCSQRFSP